MMKLIFCFYETLFNEKQQKYHSHIFALMLGKWHNHIFFFEVTIHLLIQEKARSYF